MSTSPEILVEARGPVEIWTINGEARRNSISVAMLARLGELVADAARRSLRAVVITGAGDKAFCAGADLKERAGMTPEQVTRFLLDLRGAFRAIEVADTVFLAAINGAAFGGGTELSLACDLRLASSSAELGLTEVKLGIIPGGGGTQRLPRLIGLARAKDLILSGRRVGADEALSLGLVNRVSPDGRVLADAVVWAEEIASNAPIAVAAAKRAISEGLTMPMDQALDLEREQYQRTVGTADRLEGLAAFREKRKPVYQGK